MNLVMKSVFSSAMILCLGLTAKAGLIEHKDGEAIQESYLAMPKGAGPFPAVLIVHDWMGLSDFTKAKADEMAKAGYVALAVDVYGKGVRPKDAAEAGALAGKFKGDLPSLRSRMNSGLKLLLEQKGVDKKHVVAFGYCFGGTSVLELARSGADIAGVASFHGGLATKNLDDAKSIKAKVLVMHGAIDPYVSAAEVATFEKEMNDAKVDYQLAKYSGAVHAFTIPGAGDDISKGAAYNKVADHRSWELFHNFLAEVAPAKLKK